MQLGAAMKNVCYVWLEKQDKEADDVLSIIGETGLEIAQLTRLHDYRFCKKNSASAYRYNVWSLRPTHYCDDLITLHLGDGWQNEAHRGFRTIQQFKLWLEDRSNKKYVS